ncbi:type II toxin-antitoxin system HicB family antitoxin [bacterium]|nr:type II toxin-antitoxin system HicB family antitoxin [bacterium]
MPKQYTGIIKKDGIFYVALCLELNVASQGKSIAEAKQMFEEACNEYLSYMRDEGLEAEIQPVSSDLLREFLLEDVEVVRPTPDWTYSENKIDYHQQNS